jgi:transcriptional regulator with XRE-family HTH domain
MKEKELRAILSENIKQHRAHNKMSQLDLANKLEISTNFLSDVERCKTWVSPLTLVKLAAALNIEPYELLKPTARVSHEEKDIMGKYAEDTVVAVQRALETVRRSYMENNA